MTRDRQIREATDLYALVSQYVRLKRGREFATGLCPFHADSNASLRVNFAGRHKGRFKCWSCDAKGDAQDFLARIEGITPFEAMKRLAADAGIALDGPVETPRQRADRRADRENALRWYRARWKYWRGALDAALRNGPPEFGSAEDRKADLYGSMIRLTEAFAGTEHGLQVWREAGKPVVPKPAGQYRLNLLMRRLLNAWICSMAVEAVCQDDWPEIYRRLG